MCPAIFADNANGKRIRWRYEAWASAGTGGAEGVDTGLPGADCGWACPRPGIRNMSGEIEGESAKPPQPLASNAIATKVAKSIWLQLNFTRAL